MQYIKNIEKLTKRLSISEIDNITTFIKQVYKKEDISTAEKLNLFFENKSKLSDCDIYSLADLCSDFYVDMSAHAKTEEEKQ